MIISFILLLPHVFSNPLSTNVTIATSIDYTGIGAFESVAPRGTPTYFTTLRRDYKFRLTSWGDPAAALEGEGKFWAYLYQIDMRIEPGDECSGTGGAGCGDATSGVTAGDDLQFGYIQNAHISTCKKTEFEDDPNCGTFVEVHRAQSRADAVLTDAVAEVLADIKLENGDGTFVTTPLSTAGLCTGDYELWWVVRTRSGPYVQFRKPFTVLSPSCE
jgi:hypothetical protein